VFPFAKKVVDDFVIEALRLDPLAIVNEVKKQSDIESSDSEIESLGSLNEFVVDESSEDESDKSDSSSNSSSSYSSSSSLESSNYSDETPQKKKRKISPSESSSSGYSS
jgi:methionine salvage enolase-phosphatase E1